MPTRCHTGTARQRGASAVEFTLVAVPMLLVGLGTVELGRWFFVKQAVSLALLEAGRAGITDHARPQSIESAFEQALLPLFPATATHSSQQRLESALAPRWQATGASAWQIKVVSPNAAMFNDFASPQAKVADAQGLAVINNSYQAQQHQAHLNKGWPHGRGPASGATIFDANSLVLHLSYMHEPLVPGMQALLGLLSNASSGHSRAALAGGYLPMQQTLRLTMQSHPVAWPRTGTKVYSEEDPSPPGSAATTACRGIWCSVARPNTMQPLNPSWPPAAPKVAAPTGPPEHSAPPPNPPATHAPNPNALPAPSELDEACGVVLCCVGA